MTVDADLAIQEERSAKLFGECSCGVLLQYGVCQACNPDEWAKRDAHARKVEAEQIDAERRVRAEKNKPIAALADLIETRRDAQHYRGMCDALRRGYATDLQIRLARRLTKPGALKRAARKAQ